MLKISSRPEVIASISAAAPEGQLVEQDGDTLSLDVGAGIVFAYEQLVAATAAIYRKLAPYITAKPEMELEIEGPGGKIKLKMKNLSERAILESAERVMQHSKGS